ncbi:MAG: hypothetical protein OSB70_01330 [Myxococcota bacterium]|nr:hypothetical protein [Myxococcota bacterium]
MSSIKPGILIGSLASLVLAGLLIWIAQPAPELEAPTSPAAAPEPGGSTATVSPANPQVQPAPEAKSAEQNAEARLKRHLLAGQKQREKARQKKLVQRERALDRLAELKYSQAEGERLRDRWEANMGEAEARINELELNGQAIDGVIRRAEYQVAHDQLRREFGEEDYASARYADNLSTAVRLGDLTVDSPADKAGFYPEDGIAGAFTATSPDEQVSFLSNDDLRRFTKGLPPGEIVTYIVLRNGKSLYIEVGNRGYLGVSTYGHIEAP